MCFCFATRVCHNKTVRLGKMAAIKQRAGIHGDLKELENDKTNEGETLQTSSEVYILNTF